MWVRSDLKAKGKAAFLRNYWKCVLVAFILGILTASASGSGFSSGAKSTGDNIQNNPAFAELKQTFDEIQAQLGIEAVIAVIAVIVGVLALIAIVAVILDVLVFNPLIVGCSAFFAKNSKENAELGELKGGFGPRWGNTVLTMFLHDLFLALWFALLVVPGFIKMYSYRMVPYLLANEPELKGTEVITRSREMMNGHKWNAFVLDLSFIGWYILSALTLGLLAVFYVAPYKASTDAELYHAIKAEYEGRTGTIA